jgi:hypothetical protein
MDCRRLQVALLACSGAAGVLPAPSAVAATCCSTTVYRDYECHYDTPPARWAWQFLVVGQGQFLSPGTTMVGRATDCWETNWHLCPDTPRCPDGGVTCCSSHSESCTLQMPPASECNGYVPPADRAGWVWADGRLGTYTPYPAYSYNSTGAANQVTNVAVGQYRVLFPQLAGRDGNVQVVAYGSSNNRCKVGSWQGQPSLTGPGDLSVDVRCHTPAGSPVNTPFVVNFLSSDDVGTANAQIGYALYIHGVVPGPGAAAYQWNSAGARPTTTRVEKGYYKVRFHGQLNSKANVVLTAFGTDPTFCQVIAWGSDGAGTDVQVFCYDTAGNLADSSFALRYEWRQFTGVPTQTLAGYVLASKSTTASYTPTSQFNASGTANSATRAGVGTYSVAYPGLAGGIDSSSTVLLTASAIGPSYCKPTNWGMSGGAVTVNARCFNHTGAPADRAYSEVFLSRPQAGPILQQ